VSPLRSHRVVGRAKGSSQLVVQRLPDVHTTYPAQGEDDLATVSEILILVMSEGKLTSVTWTVWRPDSSTDCVSADRRAGQCRQAGPYQLSCRYLTTAIHSQYMSGVAKRSVTYLCEMILEHNSSFVVDRARDAFHATTTCKSSYNHDGQPLTADSFPLVCVIPDAAFGDTLQVVTEYLSSNMRQ